MDISDKSIDSFGLQSIFMEKRRLRLDRLNIHIFIALQNVREIDRLPLH
jgi:hypothetical protein